MKTQSVIVASLLTALALPVFAQTGTPAAPAAPAAVTATTQAAPKAETMKKSHVKHVKAKKEAAKTEGAATDAVKK